MNRRRLTSLVGLVAVVPLAAAAGCGSDDGPPREPADTPGTAVDADRPASDQYASVLTGTTEGIDWTVYEAETSELTCIHVVAVPQPEVEPLADYPTTLNPSEATCVRKARLRKERTALINPTTYYALSVDADGVWGVADASVEDLTFRWAQDGVEVVPRDGVFFVAVKTGATDYEVEVGRDDGSTVTCRPFQPLQELTVYCQ